MVFLVAWSRLLQPYRIELPVRSFLLFPCLEQRDFLPAVGKVRGSFVEQVYLILADLLECLVLHFFRIDEVGEVLGLSLLARSFIGPFGCRLQTVIDVFSLPTVLASYLGLSPAGRVRQCLLRRVILMRMRGVQLLQDGGLNILDVPQYLLEVVLVEFLAGVLPLSPGLAPAAPLHFITLNLE